jgi:hypothetical protein
MPTLVLFKKWGDPWHRTDETGFNKTGFVTENGIVIYPRRSRIARMSIEAVRKKPHRLLQIDHPRAEQIETFFTSNVMNTHLYVKGMQQIADANSPFWNNPVKLPILTPINPAEHEARWSRIPGILQKGDGIFTLDTKSIASRLISYLDQGTWSHVGTYVGNGQIVEANTLGVVERSIEAYHDTRYRLGVYRLPGASPEQIVSLVAFNRSHVGDRYSYRKAFTLGIRLALGLWPSSGARHTTPNMLITKAGYDLIGIV